MSEQPFSLRRIAVKVYSPSLLYGLGLGAVTPIIALSALERGANLATAALVVTLVGVGSLVSNVPAAVLTTKVGERLAMVCAAGWAALGMVLGIVPSNLGLFAVGVMMLGMAGAVFNLARQTYLAEAVPLEFRARAMSTLGGVMRIGVFIGPFAATLAMKWLGIAGAYWVGMVAMAIATVVCLGIPDLETRAPVEAGQSRDGGSMLSIAKDQWRILLGIGLGIVCISAVRSTRQVVLPLWGESIGLDAATISLVYGFSGAIDMLIFYPAGKVMDKRGRAWVAVPCMAVMSLALFLLPLTHSMPTMLAVAMVLGFGNGIGSGIVMTLGADYSPVAGRPKFLGLWRLMSDTGAMAGPVLLSVLVAVATLGAGVMAIGGISLLGAGIFGYFIPRTNRRRMGAP
ncbi:MFS transporter [Paeniglutamicibacter psychrophenolicus]|uniref:MFS family permease n=1 Tax=Paeniglutamicibacter psychrophenolicus TaxID=257454 RepID=A0ABS4WCG6_9MICC|nr:MFS transporter [Paeniglutamicibacter psychrophenolicus]MBP2373890.1 MFS family permease [Paeniglutamicibacter psychrophenolicus]